MTDEPTFPYDDLVAPPASVGFVCGVPASEIEIVATEREPERWCFGERKRRAGTWTCTRPTFDYLMRTEAWGWAEPVWRYRCDGCGQDRRAFPGWDAWSPW